jgi:N-acetylmuramoyl-L-alanine amidase
MRAKQALLSGGLALCLAGYSLLGQAALVAIDVGHSQAHPGATSARGRPEFAFNLDLARDIQSRLAASKVPAFLIGDDGLMNVLTARTAQAAARGATFFLSIHHDSAQLQYLEPWSWQGVSHLHGERFAGYSLFVSRKNPQFEASLACAHQIGVALQQAGFHLSAHHAEAIAGENRAWADAAAGVYAYDDLVVLKTAASPAVLLEAGVIVNRDEETVLQDATVRSRIAAAVATGLTTCGATP